MIFQFDYRIEAVFILFLFRLRLLLHCKGCSGSEDQKRSNVEANFGIVLGAGVLNNILKVYTYGRIHLETKNSRSRDNKCSRLEYKRIIDLIAIYR